MIQQKTSVFRKLAIHGFNAVNNGHNLYALLEFDITNIRSMLRSRRMAGSGGSLFSFLLKVIGKCLEDFPEFNSMVSMKRTSVFDEVDINIPIEIEHDNRKYTKQLIIRNINSKPLSMVDQEIEEARQNSGDEKGFISSKKSAALLGILPGIIVRIIFRIVMSSHRRIRDLSGTVFVTSVSMFTNVPGYIIPYSGGPKAVSFAVGSSVKKPVAVNNKIEIREMINITIIFNHDSVDGAPAARFINQLRKYIESDFEQFLC